MSKIFLLSLIIISLISCNQSGSFTESEIKAIQDENLYLKQQLDDLKKEKEKSKFVWSVIYCKTGQYSYNPPKGKSNFQNGVNDKIYFSDIVELNQIDESTKYKLQDDLESKVRNQLGNALHSIQSRKTYVFDSYEEASQFKFKTIND